ncbi:MAG TPA: hydroxymethylbilane synthase, partial [Acidimicrobiales bacterium]|nr:hydroxymethylbilane synthase [Acidimicrobiales bacterium]
PAPRPVTRVLRAATRGSALARWQTDHVASLLRAAHGDLEVEPVVVQTEGDRRQDVPLDKIGGRGVFVKEVQAAVLDGRADIAVHSAKDLPSAPELQPAGLVIACVPEREDPRDVLVGSKLDDLPVGGVVATGSARRRAQLAHLRPDLTFSDLRGNIDTRLAKARDFDAIVMAAAALIRLGRIDVATEILDADVMVPQVAQGALAIECRADDTSTIGALHAIEHARSRRAVEAERAYLASLGGGCDLPVGAYATVDAAGDAARGVITLTGMLATPDGHSLIRATRTGSDPKALGHEVASYLLDGCGGHSFLGR